MTSESPAVPFSVRVMLGHAAVQRVADLHAVDILHLKGFALDDTVSWEGRVGSDVDVLVRPDQVGRLLGALSASGWNCVPIISGEKRTAIIARSTSK